MVKSLSQLIRRAAWILLGLALIFFAVKNRGGVPVSFEPIAGVQNIPIWIILFAGIFIGLAVSAAVTSWLRLEGFAKRRKAERRADYLDSQMALMAEDAHKGRAAHAHAAATEDAGEDIGSHPTPMSAGSLAKPE